MLLHALLLLFRLLSSVFLELCLTVVLKEKRWCGKKQAPLPRNSRCLALYTGNLAPEVREGWNIPKALHIDVIDEVSTEPKPFAQEYLKACAQSLHHFDLTEALLEGLGAERPEPRCRWHNCSTCLEGVQKNPDIVLAGVPCAPYSGQRPGRFTHAKRWAWVQK